MRDFLIFFNKHVIYKFKEFKYFSTSGNKSVPKQGLIYDCLIRKKNLRLTSLAQT